MKSNMKSYLQPETVLIPVEFQSIIMRSNEKVHDDSQHPEGIPTDLMD